MHTVRPAPMAPATGAAALVAALVAHGVDAVFAIPGTHNLGVIAALARHGVRAVTPRHEQGAGYAADGYARLGGRPGVCLTTTGPAALNAAAAAAQAQSDSVPVLFLAPGMPTRHPGRGDGMLHEVLDQRAAFAGIVEHTHRVASVAEIPAAVAEAVAAMTAGRPRPAYLEIPLDLLETESAYVACPPLPRSVVTAPPEQVEAALECLGRSVRPLIVAGGGASTAAAELRLVAERLAAPVVMTANGKGVLAEDHQLAVGAGLHHPAFAELAAGSDLVLVVGTELAPADLWNGPLVAGGPVVRIDVDPHRMLANIIPDVALLGESAHALAALADGLPVSRRVPGSGPERAADARRALLAQAEIEGRPYLGLVRAIDDVLGRDGVIAGDSTMACYYGALSNARRNRPRSLLYPAGAGTLGYGLPAGIGAKIACPDRPVIVLHGDGGLMFSVAELATAAQLGLALPVVVVDNGGYGEIRNEMRERGEPLVGVELGAPEFALLGEALGCVGAETDESGLADVLRTALVADRPTVIHLRETEFDPVSM